MLQRGCIMASKNTLKERKKARKATKTLHKTAETSSQATNPISLRVIEGFRYNVLFYIVVLGLLSLVALQVLPSNNSSRSLKDKENASNSNNHFSNNERDDTVYPDKETDKMKPSSSNQNFLHPSTLILKGRDVSYTKIHHGNKQSSVEVYVYENVLTKFECDSLCSVHSKHIETINSTPLFCFESIETLQFHLKELKQRYKLSYEDFITGTTCLNESISNSLKQYFKFSYSTAFYPGESKFSSTFAAVLENITGLKKNHGGKFQITSYGENVGYKSHLDCVINKEKRDRYATALIYLQDVAEGGETVFPKLNITIKPKQGRMLLWNSMDSNGDCDPTSLHYAAPVIKGHKYILQRWYYYQSFPQLGKRPREPSVPSRAASTPRVQCDDYKYGSCRWYDEWGYDHLVEYKAIKHSLT